VFQQGISAAPITPNPDIQALIATKQKQSSLNQTVQEDYISKPAHIRPP
jgi:hypothetical protein